MRSLLLGLLFFGLCMGMACGAAQPAQSSSPTPAGGQPGELAVDGGLVLLEPGAEPRLPLRYTFTAGVQEAALDIAMRVEGGAGGKQVVSPTVRFGMLIEPGAVNGEELSYVSKIISAKLLEDTNMPSALRADIDKELATYVGLKGDAVTNSRGIAKQVLFELPDHVGENLEFIMDTLQIALWTLSVPMPEESVGVGAKWRVTSAVPGLVPMNRTTTFTLVATDGDSATVEIAQEYTATPQALASRAPKDGVKQELLSLSGKGSGRASLRFGELLPDSAVTFNLKSAVRVTRPKTEQTIETDATFDLSLVPRR